MVSCARAADPMLSTKAVTGWVTPLATLSADPKMRPPSERRPRTGPAEEFRASKVIRARAATTSTASTTRVRRLSCTGSPDSCRTRDAAAPCEGRGSAPGLWDWYLAERVEILHALAGSQHHRVERVVGEVDGHARFLAQALVQPAKERAAAGERDATVHHVAGQLGRALVQGSLHRVHDERQRLLDRTTDLLGGDHDGLGQAADQVPAPDLGVRLVYDQVRGLACRLDLRG